MAEETPAAPTLPAVPALPAVTALPAAPLVSELPAAPAALPVIPLADTTNTGFMGGASFYLLRPYISNNTAYITNSGIGTPTPSTTSQDFDWAYRPAPAMWFGYTTESGLGIRARAFYFDQSPTTLTTSLNPNTAATATITPPAGLSPVVGIPPVGFAAPGILLGGGAGQDQLAFSSSLRIQTIDMEATYAWNLDSFALLFSGGGRYLQMSQNYNATLVNVPGTGASEYDALIAGHNFYGGGPTVALQCDWKVGSTGLSLYGLARGSVIVGTGRQDVFFSQVIIDPVLGNQDNQPSNRSTFQQVIPIAELEVGVQYGLMVGRSEFFVRGAAVNQTYFGAGSSTARDTNLSLFGVQFSTGLNY